MRTTSSLRTAGPNIQRPTICGASQASNTRSGVTLKWRVTRAKTGFSRSTGGISVFLESVGRSQCAERVGDRLAHRRGLLGNGLAQQLELATRGMELIEQGHDGLGRLVIETD